MIIGTLVNLLLINILFHFVSFSSSCYIPYAFHFHKTVFILSFICLNFLRNNICTTIFILFLYNFLSHTHIIFLFSFFLFLSLLFLTNEKRKQKVVPKVVSKELFKYHYLNFFGMIWVSLCVIVENNDTFGLAFTNCFSCFEHFCHENIEAKNCRFKLGVRLIPSHRKKTNLA